MPRLMVIAAEASADAHAAAVVRAFLDDDPTAEFFGLAGPALRGQGVEAVADTEDISVMGFTEVIPALPRIFRTMKRLALAAAARRPDLALLVDSPDLNLRMARRLRRLGIPILYYIAPMVWAWRRGRIGKVGRLVDRLCVILPFEEAIWRGGGVDAVYVGSPLLDHPEVLGPALLGAGEADERKAAISPANGKEALKEALGLDPRALTLAVLPGSRRTEIRRCLPSMLKAAALLARRTQGPLQIALPRAPTIDASFIVETAGSLSRDVPLHVLSEGTHAVLSASDAAVIASGTAALEGVLTQTPMVVVYRVSWLTWLAARLLVRTPFVSLPNLLAGRKVVPELLQSKMRPETICAELLRVIPGGEGREEMLSDLELVRRGMGSAGAARRVAVEARMLIEGRERGADE